MMYNNLYNPYNYANGMNYNGQLQNLQQPLQQTQGLIKVTGIEGAKAYQMPPNSITALFDSNEDIFYVKSTDGAGFPTIKTYKFTTVQGNIQASKPTIDFVSREEFEQFKMEVMNNGKQSVPKSAKSDSK